MEEKKGRVIKEVWGWAKAIAIAFILVFVVRTFLFVPIVVQGDSMDPTLHDKERMFLNKMNVTLNKIERFDIVVFKAPDGADYIKRIVGLPGENVEFKNDILYINGKAIDEPFLDERKAARTETGPLTYDFTLEEVTGLREVPENAYFVLGDNRDGSTDSRMIGCISKDKMEGTASIVYYPFKQMRIAE
ncbi:MAG: signal peptidase I [Bacilli bacterium]